MKKRLLALTGLLLAGVLFLTLSCAPTAVTTTPKPSPSPTQTPSPTPGSTTTPAHPVRNIVIWGSDVGSDSYNYSFAAATIVNRYSSWLRLETKATDGTVVHLKSMGLDPSQGKTAIFTATTVHAEMASKAIVPFDKVYDGARAIALFSASASALITYNPNIKTYDDLVGKRVMIFPQPWFQARTRTVLFNDVMGIGSKINLSFGSDEDAICRALRDGTIDVGMTGINGMLGGPYTPGASLMQLISEKPGVKFIGFPDAATFAKISAAAKFNVPYDTIAAKSLTPDQQAFLTDEVFLTWYADKSLDNEVAYEFVKVLGQHIAELKQYFPPSVTTKDKLGALPITESQFHPGAVQAFKELGVKIGQ